MKSSEISQSAKAIVFGAAFLWGIWTLVPVAMACVLAFVVSVHFGMQALSVPAWGIGVGASMLVLALGTAATLRPAPRAELLRSFWLWGKVSALLLVAVGALMLIFSNTPESDAGGSSLNARLEVATRQVANDLAVGAGWLILVVIPTCFAATAMFHLWTEYSRQRDGARN